MNTQNINYTLRRDRLFVCTITTNYSTRARVFRVCPYPRVARREATPPLSLSLSLFFFTSLLLNRTTGFLFLDFNNRWIHVRFDDLVED